MAVPYGNGKKYTKAATLISLLVQALSTNAAPFDNRREWNNRPGRHNNGYDGGYDGGGHRDWDYDGPASTDTCLPSTTSVTVRTTRTVPAPLAATTPTTSAVTFATVVTGGSTIVTVTPVSNPSTTARLSGSPGVFAPNASANSAATSSLAQTSTTTPSTSAQNVSTPTTVSSAPASIATSPSTQVAPLSSTVVANQDTSTLSTASGSTGLISQSVGGIFAETLSLKTITPTDTPTIEPATTGSLGTSLQTSGNPSVIPFPTSVITTTSATISPTSLDSSVTRTVADALPTGSNIFVPIGMDPAPFMVGPKDGHPIPRTGIPDNITTPIETNKFYAGFFVNDQSDSVWTHPYSVRWTKGYNNIQSWGIAVSHIERSQVAFGPGSPAQYFVNPIGIDSLVFSALEFGSSTVLTTDNHKAFSVNAHLAPYAGGAPLLTMPLVQGMGFVTGIYSYGTPLIQSGVFFRALSPLSVSNGISKTTATLQDGTQWVIYVIPNDANSSPNIILNDSQTIQISSGFSGIIQVAKLAGGDTAPGIYDSSAGVYAVAGEVSGTIVSQFTLPVTGTTTASYSLSWTKAGATSKTLLMFALPHHVQSFDGTTGALKTPITLQTTTKGIATGLLADRWTMIEQLPNEMSFAPYSPSKGSVTTMPAAAVSLIAQTAAEELGEDINAQTNLDTMYFSGKGLAKFAAVVYVAHDLANTTGIAAAGLVKLKAAFDVFVQNHQTNRLVYDTTWKGVVSIAGYTDIGADFGGKIFLASRKDRSLTVLGTAYNDHHFHYGYFVYAAAVIGYLDPAWVQNAQNKAWVNMLVRDFANSAYDDPYFPFSRSFDWYHGHRYVTVARIYLLVVSPTNS
jgi:endo-1,3(4)-beta-glucanase